ncbi:MAG: hypothetical protein GXO05_03455 [Aquificae bacterium]|nr:hypothetical protein [Aquificota bacterium]
MEILMAVLINVHTVIASDRQKDCFRISVCACRENRCMVYPTTCVPEGWKIEDFTKCETSPKTIKIPMH